MQIRHVLEQIRYHSQQLKYHLEQAGYELQQTVGQPQMRYSSEQTQCQLEQIRYSEQQVRYAIATQVYHKSGITSQVQRIASQVWNSNSGMVSGIQASQVLQVRYSKSGIASQVQQVRYNKPGITTQVLTQIRYSNTWVTRQYLVCSEQTRSAEQTRYNKPGIPDLLSVSVLVW